jgi:hypothetical protein
LRLSNALIALPLMLFISDRKLHDGIGLAQFDVAQFDVVHIDGEASFDDFADVGDQFLHDAAVA